MADDSLDFLESGPRYGGRLRPRKIRQPNSTGTVVGVVGAFVVLVLLGGFIAYNTLGKPPEKPTFATSGPQTYAQALQVWKDETEMLGKMRVSRLLANRRMDEMGRAAYNEATSANVAAHQAAWDEVRQWDKDIAEQERKAERARLRKESLDR